MYDKQSILFETTGSTQTILLADDSSATIALGQRFTGSLSTKSKPAVAFKVVVVAGNWWKLAASFFRTSTLACRSAKEILYRATGTLLVVARQGRCIIRVRQLERRAASSF